MDIRDTLRLPSFASAEVVAGEDRLDNMVTSAMILEATDIEKWAKRGMLIITSYFALQNLDDAELEKFFEKVDAIGISGIIVKVERLVRRIPESMVRLCEEHGVPLISVNKEVKYDSLLMDVFGNVLESNLTLLNHFYKVHRQIMELATAQPTVYQILTSLKHSIGREVTFFDARQQSRTSTTNAPSDFASWNLRELEAERYQSFARFEAELSYEDGRRASAFTMEVPSQEPRRYYVIVHGDRESLDSIDIMTVENYASLLQMEALKQSALARQLFIQHNNTTLDLLLSRYSTHEQIDTALKNLAVDAFPLYQILLVHIRTVRAEDEFRRHDVLEAARRGIQASYPNFAYFMSNDRIVILYNYGDEARQLRKSVVQEVLGNLHENPSLPEFTHIAAISDSVDRYSIGSINKEVLNIYQTFGATAPANHCIHYNELGCLRIFFDVEDFSTLRDSVDSRILRLYDENPELFTTLVTLCENNLRYQDTAKQLFLHPKTVRYRITQIEATYDIDVHGPNDFLQILLAGKVMALVENAL